MRKVIKKFFWAWEYEKEEKWLNEMAAKGLALVDYSIFRYSFEPCEPGEYTFKIQLLEHNPNHPESEQYIREVAVEGRKRTYALTPRGAGAFYEELTRLRMCVADAEKGGDL